MAGATEPRRARATSAPVRSAPSAATACAIAPAKVRCPLPLRGSVRVAPRQLHGPSVAARRAVAGARALRALRVLEATNSTVCQRMSLSGSPQRRAAPRRLRCPPARGRTASAEASRRLGEVRGIRELRWVWERGGLLDMIYGSDRAAQWWRAFTSSSASLGRGRSGLGCRPQRRMWDLAAITTDPACTA